MKKYSYLVAAIALMSVVSLGSIASAQTLSSTPVVASSIGVSAPTGSITKMQTNADTAIAKRIASLNTLNSRINTDYKNLSTAQKATFSASIQTAISNLTTLKAKIDADTDPATLRTDVKSIFISNRIYMVFMPQTRIMARGDRDLNAVTNLNTKVSTLQTRVTSAQSAGHDTTALQASLADATAKLSDAQIQANAAINTVSPLVPDQGNATVIASNKAAIASAHTAMNTLKQDLKTAHTDLKSVATGLKSLGF